MAIARRMDTDTYVFTVEIAGAIMRDADYWALRNGVADQFMVESRPFRRALAARNPRWEPMPEAQAGQLNEDDIHRLRERIRNAPIAPPMGAIRFRQERRYFHPPEPVAEFVPPPNTPDELLSGAKYDPWKLENQLEEAALQAHEPEPPAWGVPGPVAVGFGAAVHAGAGVVDDGLPF